MNPENQTTTTFFTLPKTKLLEVCSNNIWPTIHLSSRIESQRRGARNGDSRMLFLQNQGKETCSVTTAVDTRRVSTSSARKVRRRRFEMKVLKKRAWSKPRLKDGRRRASPLKYQGGKAKWITSRTTSSETRSKDPSPLSLNPCCQTTQIGRVILWSKSSSSSLSQTHYLEKMMIS